MARIDRFKEEIGWLKVLLGATIAVDASLIGWIVQNWTGASFPLRIAAVLLCTAATITIAYINRLAYDRLKRLEIA